MTRITYDQRRGEIETYFDRTAVQAWAQAAEKAKSSDAFKVAKAMRDGSYSTVIGPLAFDEKGDRRTTDYVVYRWSEGKYTVIPGQ